MGGVLISLNYRMGKCRYVWIVCPMTQAVLVKHSSEYEYLLPTKPTEREMNKTVCDLNVEPRTAFDIPHPNGTIFTPIGNTETWESSGSIVRQRVYGCISPTKTEANHPEAFRTEVRGTDHFHFRSRNITTVPHEEHFRERIMRIQSFVFLYR